VQLACFVGNHFGDFAKIRHGQAPLSFGEDSNTAFFRAAAFEVALAKDSRRDTFTSRRWCEKTQLAAKKWVARIRRDYSATLPFAKPVNKKVRSVRDVRAPMDAATYSKRDAPP
jgi:hypothetical protein